MGWLEESRKAAAVAVVEAVAVTDMIGEPEEEGVAPERKMDTNMVATRA